jgi:murein L,D-transpeptidase YafK
MRLIPRALLMASALALLSACSSMSDSVPKHERPLSEAMRDLMREKGMTERSPIFVRVFKKESELEVWKARRDGTYALLKTYPVCRWSGQLGPKKREGDRQTPEGFYMVTSSQMNPRSAYYLSYDIGYPNAYDQALGRTGGDVMVHGACTSRGCFAMTDEQAAELYALAREAFDGGMSAFPVHSFPFRMTPANLAKHRADENIAFWKNLKEGNDHFEVTKRPPQVAACGGRYVFNAKPTHESASVEADAACPDLTKDPIVTAKVAEKQARDEVEVSRLIAQGVEAVRAVYADGSMHPSFANKITSADGQMSLAFKEAGVSRPEKVKLEPTYVPIGEVTGSVRR